MNTLSPIAVVTDSAASIPPELREEYRIGIIPYYVHMGQQAYQSGIDLVPDQFFHRLRAAPDLEVSTAVPPITAFVEAYKKVAKWAKAIVSVHIASKQSGGCSAAEVAARESPVPVIVVDSETTAMAQGFVALEAAREAARGASLEQVVEKARSVVQSAGLIALLENINYAVKGGRLGSAARLVGDLLKIQPLVRVQNNRVSLAGQVRRRSKGISALIDKVKDEVREDPVHLTVHYAEDEQEGQRVLDRLKSSVNCIESYLTRVPIELGVHAGPGAIGIAYYVERESVNLKEQLGKLTEYAKEAIRSRLP